MLGELGKIALEGAVAGVVHAGVEHMLNHHDHSQLTDANDPMFHSGPVFHPGTQDYHPGPSYIPPIPTSIFDAPIVFDDPDKGMCVSSQLFGW